MLQKSAILTSYVTVFLNANISHLNLTAYKPVQTKESSLYFVTNYNTISVEFVPVKEDSTIAYFPKCCPPKFKYDSEKRSCELTTDDSIRPIYEELDIKSNFVKSGLNNCTVIVDRFVAKSNLTVSREESAEDDGLIVDVDGTNAERFSSGRYCFDEIGEDANYYVLRLCYGKEYCSNTTLNNNSYAADWCIRKCCQDGYGLENQQCKFTNRNGLRVKHNAKFFERVDGYALLHENHLQCESNSYAFANREFNIRTNGSMFIINENNREYRPDTYCIETNYDTASKYVYEMLYTCKIYDKTLIWVLTKTVAIISCVCFTITLLIYVFVHEVRKLTEKIVTCICVVGLVFWTLFSMRLFLQSFGNYCNLFGYIYFFVWMARLSWLNVFSFEIWRTIGNTRARVGETKESLRKKMAYYSLYGWLIPTLITIVFVMSHEQVYTLPKQLIPLINPIGCHIDLRQIDGILPIFLTVYIMINHIGFLRNKMKGPLIMKQCISDNNLGYLHFYIPVLVLTLINVVFFVRTVIHFVKIKRGLERITDSSANTKQKMKDASQKNGIIIFKLGLIMGLTFIFYLYAYLVATITVHILNSIKNIWSFTNYLEGLYILIIFTFDVKTFKKILRKVNISKRNANNGTHGRETSTKSVETVNSMVMESVEESTLA